MSETESTGFSIGDLAKRTGATVETIRYYEKIGLLTKPARTLGNQRAYTQRDLDRLAFIRHGRELGFSLEDVKTLLDLSDDPNRPCEQADAIARHHLLAVRSRISRLRALEAELARMVAECGCGQVSDCRVIEVLADHSHSHCMVDDHGGTGL